MRLMLATLLILAMNFAPVVAGTRTWTSSDGRFTTAAELVDFQDGLVHLQRADGQMVRVPLASLSADDREFVKTMLPGVEEPQIRPGSRVREWTSQGGGFTTMAEFLGYDAGKVQLRKLDGEEISVPLAALGDADRDWVREELVRRRTDEASSDHEEDDAEEPIDALGPQTIAMRALRLDPGRGRRPNRAVGYFLRMTQPQHFHIQLGEGGKDTEALFRRTVRQEPEYQVPVPLRAVVKLGSQQFGFALDAVGKRVAGYNRLYFDLNGNGDLTDDEPIDATDVSGTPAGGVVQSRFPPVDVELNVDGATVEYTLLLSALAGQKPVPFASASMYAGMVREGYVEQGGSKVRLVLVDQNTNGRFDDHVAIRMVGGRVIPTEGDLLLVNPNPRNVLSADATMGRDRHYVSRTVCIGSHFYEMDVSSAGDRVTLSPKELALGYVTNPSPAYRAMAYSEQYGTVMLGGTKGTKIPLPAGPWRVAGYSIDASGMTGGARTAATATCGDAYPAVEVVEGETVELPFGVPFRAKVAATRATGGRVALSLSIVGAAGERVTSIYVNGRRPPAPRFVITDSEGDVVHQGAFEYG